MLTVSGIVYINTVPEERETAHGVSFHFEGVSKNPYSQAYKVYRVEVFVPTTHLRIARERIARNKVIQIRLGELEGFKNDMSVFITTVRTKWIWIELLKTIPVPEKQTE